MWQSLMRLLVLLQQLCVASLRMLGLSFSWTRSAHQSAGRYELTLGQGLAETDRTKASDTGSSDELVHVLA